MKLVINLISGIFVGMANIIPGVSGGTIAVILQVYEDLLTLTSLDIKRIFQNWKSLLALCLGILVGALLFAKVMNFIYQRYPIYTAFFFIGIIVGSVPSLYALMTAPKPQLDSDNGAATDNALDINTSTTAQLDSNSKLDSNAGTKSKTQPTNLTTRLVKLAFVLIGFSIMVALFLLQRESGFSQVEITSAGQYFLLFVAGLVAAISMLIPGISGSFVLLIIGIYGAIISAIADMQIVVLGIFGFGVVMGLVLASRLIIVVLKHYSAILYALIFGLVLGSILQLIPFTMQSAMGFLISGLSFLLGIAVIVLFIVLGKTKTR